MATRKVKAVNGGSGSKLGFFMAALATAGAVRLLSTRTRRDRLARTASKLGKAAATMIAASEVLKNAGPILRRKPRSRFAWLSN